MTKMVTELESTMIKSHSTYCIRQDRYWTEEIQLQIHQYAWLHEHSEWLKAHMAQSTHLRQDILKQDYLYTDGSDVNISITESVVALCPLLLYLIRDY
jgi:hypothetical protein